MTVSFPDSPAIRNGSLALLVLLLVASALIAALGHWSYATQDRDSIDASATAQHWTGTDDLGRDRTVRVAVALLLALAGATGASLLATLIGAAIGTTAALATPIAGKLLLFASDLLLTLPWLFLLMIVRSALPLNLAPAASATVTFLLLGLLGWPAFARMNYARTAAVRDSGWMLQARATGLRPWQLARTHILPHLTPLLLTQFLIYLPICITAEANLGTLGLGIGEPLPSWGSMLLALRSTAILSGSRWIYLPLVLLVMVLLLLEMSVVEEES